VLLHPRAIFNDIGKHATSQKRNFFLPKFMTCIMPSIAGFFFKFPSVYKLATHMLRGGGTIDNQCDFFISEVGTLHYFELGS
jgi:hypothetical protein